MVQVYALIITYYAMEDSFGNDDPDSHTIALFSTLMLAQNAQLKTDQQNNLLGYEVGTRILTMTLDDPNVTIDI